MHLFCGWGGTTRWQRFSVRDLCALCLILACMHSGWGDVMRCGVFIWDRKKEKGSESRKTEESGAGGQRKKEQPGRMREAAGRVKVDSEGLQSYPNLVVINY